MGQNEALQLLDKYLKNDCSEEEKRKVEAWLDALENPQRSWTSLSESEQQAYIRQLLSDLQMDLRNRHSRKSAVKHPFVWTAAAVLLLLVTTGLFYRYFNHGNQKAPAQSKWLVVETGIGERKEVKFGDGTHVRLNASSSLKYPKHFGPTARIVKLEGEAFFDVERDPHRPFEVESVDWRIRVLGTSFNVDSYREDQAIKIAVLSGKVGIDRVKEKRDQQHIVRAHELASYDQQNRNWQIDTIGVDIKKPLWVLGQLAFYHTPMHEVAKTLYRTYGIIIHFENGKIQQCEISGHFEIDQKPENILRAICLSIGGDFTKQGMAVTISGTGCL